METFQSAPLNCFSISFPVLSLSLLGFFKKSFTGECLALSCNCTHSVLQLSFPLTAASLWIEIYRAVGKVRVEHLAALQFCRACTSNARESVWCLKFNLQVCDLYLFFCRTVGFFSQISFPEYYILIQTNEMLFILCLSYRCNIKSKSRVGIDQGRFTNVPVCTSQASTFLSLCSCCNFNHAFHQFSLLRWYSSPACLSWISVPQNSACPKCCWLSAPRLVSQAFHLLSHAVVLSMIWSFCCEEQIFCLLHLPQKHIVRGLMQTSR